MTSNQKAFNKAVRFLYKQKEQSLDSNGNYCAYRGENGKRCAAGALIPNKLYRRVMERTSCDVPFHPVSEVLNKLGYDPYFVRELQIVHDDNEPCHWHEGFQGVAHEYNLTWPKDVPTTCWISIGNESEED